MVTTLLKSAGVKLLNLLHVLRAVCSLQLQSLNMDASFLDRNVNEGFSGTQSWHAHPHLPYCIENGGLMRAGFLWYYKPLVADTTCRLAEHTCCFFQVLMQFSLASRHCAVQSWPAYAYTWLSESCIASAVMHMLPSLGSSLND